MQEKAARLSQRDKAIILLRSASIFHLVLLQRDERTLDEDDIGFNDLITVLFCP